MLREVMFEKIELAGKSETEIEDKVSFSMSLLTVFWEAGFVKAFTVSIYLNKDLLCFPSIFNSKLALRISNTTFCYLFSSCSQKWLFTDLNRLILKARNLLIQHLGKSITYCFERVLLRINFDQFMKFTMNHCTTT